MTIKSSKLPKITLEDPLHLADPRTLDLANYLTVSKLNIPAAFDWTTKKTTPWGMMGNWVLSDCLCAAAGHMIECWTANTTGEVYIDDNAILNAYIALTGYDPVTGNNATGVGFTNLLKYWRNTGIGNHKIKAYTAVKYNKPEFLRACIYLFGGAFVGINIANSLVVENNIWDVKPGVLTGDDIPGPDSGHAVTILGYDDQYLTFISYGEKKRMTWAFWNAYAIELYAIISEDFFVANKTVHGFDISALEADLIRVTREKPLLEKELIKDLAPAKPQAAPVMANAINTANLVTVGNLQVMSMDIGDMSWADGIFASNAMGAGWRLPTRDELNELFINKDIIGRFAAGTYWSSTLYGIGESTGDDSKLRWYQDFTNGNQGTDAMDKYGYIRAVRSVAD